MEGYTYCACRDCIEIAIGVPGVAMCWGCEEGGCVATDSASWQYCCNKSSYLEVLSDQGSVDMSGAIAERVAKGAALLDGDCPGWFRRIDFDVFCIISPSKCIIGQVYGDWSIGTDQLGMYFDRAKQADHGFEVAGEEDMSRPHELTCREFAAEWHRAVEVRLQAD